MNAAFDASAILGRSGIERYSRELIKGLLRTGSVDGVTLAASESDHGAVARYFESFPTARVVECLPHERKFGAPLRPLARWSIRRGMSSVFAGADIVHLLSPGKVIPKKKPIVTTIHDLFPMYPDMGLDHYLVKRFPGRVKRHLSASQAILCPSAYVASTIREFFPECTLPITVTPLAAGEEFVPTPMDAAVIDRYGLQKPYVLFVGRIDPRKNLHRIMYAWGMLPQSIRQHSELLLLIAGGEQAVARFRKENASVVSEASIRIITDVPTTEMIQIISAARALVFATLGEGFGLPVLEAMRCGCPVITSNTTSLPEVGGEAAMYVDPTRTEEIADAMMRCIMDDALVADRREAGLRHSASFTWDATARATAAVYRSVRG
ncbi:MAG: glycosyltransferase family 4 protein [Candidatus Kapabacteria bacterium]|nr:glycosyltransferase family 4 protein [Candidatus Kapabacteria bacterium]